MLLHHHKCVRFFFFPSFFCHIEPDSLSHDCTVAPTSHQALFSSGNHPCPYLCSPGSCHDNSLRLISLLFMERHLNDHFMDQWNAPMWMKKNTGRCINDDHRDTLITLNSTQKKKKVSGPSHHSIDQFKKEWQIQEKKIKSSCVITIGARSNQIDGLFLIMFLQGLEYLEYIGPISVWQQLHSPSSELEQLLL